MKTPKVIETVTYERELPSGRKIFRTGGTRFELTYKPGKGWIYLHDRFAGIDGFHKTPWRAWQTAQKIRPFKVVE